LARPTLSIASHGIGTLSSAAALSRPAAKNTNADPTIAGIARRQGKIQGKTLSKTRSMIRIFTFIEIDALKPTHD
jgi:hypothetical protein